MPLHVGKLRDSAFGVHVSPEAFRAGVMLWCAAWHQVPAGSLPNDIEELAMLAGYGRIMAGGEEYLSNIIAPVLADAMHNFALHSDGKLYHNFIAEIALEKSGKREKLVKAARKRWKEKKKLKDASHNASHLQGIYKGKGKGKGKGNNHYDDDDDDGEHRKSGIPVVEGDQPADTPPSTATALIEARPDIEVPYAETAPRLRSLLGDRCPDLGRLAAWIAHGADPTLDILPAIEATLGRTNGRAIHSLKYFDQPIADRLAERLNPTPMPQPGKRHGRKTSAAQARVDAFLAAVRRHQAQRHG